MAVETYSNNASSTLSGDITSGAGSLVVASAAPFPLAPQFRLLMDSELMLTTAVNGKTFTVTRGVEGTTAASHTSGTVITHILTSGGLVGVAGSVILTGTYGNLPTAGVVGRLYLPSDSVSVMRDTGAAWTPFGPLYQFTDPTTPSWAWVNQGGATVTSTGGVVSLFVPPNGSNNARIRKITAPSTPYTITAYMQAISYCIAYNQYGLVFRKNSTGELKTFDFLSSAANDLVLRVSSWSSETGEGSSAGSVSVAAPWPWMQIEDDGTNRNYRVSVDGQRWVTHYSEARNTTFVADEIGFFANAQNASAPGIGVTLFSWSQT